MKRYVGTIITVLALCLFTAPVASAHILRSDNGMSAELHMPPDDAPVANTPAGYHLEFNESNGTFSVSNCDCSIEFIVGGQTVGRQMLTATSDTVADGTFNFPKPGDYTLRVTGSPKNGATFEAFSLDYPERIGTDASSQSMSPLAGVAIGVGSGLIVLYTVVKIINGLRGRKVSDEDD